MNHEFIYYSPEQLEFPLNEEIFVTTEKSENTNYIVSNSEEINSEIVAPEINLYIQNSQDSLAEKIKNVRTLYEARAIAFDYALDLKNSKSVGNKLLIVGAPEVRDQFISQLDENNPFELFLATDDYMKGIRGTIGSLEVVLTSGGVQKVLDVDQIVWYDAQDYAFFQKGCYDPNKEEIPEIIKKLTANLESFEYKKYVTHNTNICQYHERKHEICGKCADVCPTNAIVKIDEEKHLEFSQIDCQGCGGCISICPSGAVDYAPMNKDSFYEIATLYKEKTPLIVPNKMGTEALEIEFSANILPFMIEGEKYLSEAHFLTLLQESGSSLIFYTDFLSKGSKDAINLLNEIYLRRFDKKAIYVVATQEDLKNIMKEVGTIKESQFSLNQQQLIKREIFSQRLKHIVGERDLGTVSSGEFIKYGKVLVNESSCTLCLSCVEACNVAALKADKSDNSLKIDSSICTACGYCEAVCPEKDTLSIEEFKIDLNLSWFTTRTLAQDTLFACVECGKDFATNKSIMKIANMMAPIFGEDEVKKRTLYCCADCKPKVMFQNHIEQQMKVQG